MSASESYTLIETCGDILQETLGLLEVVKRSAPPTAHLQTLLGNHFTSNDFRSFCCFGRSGEDVSLELFNCLCILPSTKWNVCLNSDTLGGIEASPMDSSAALDGRLNKLVITTKNVTTLLMNVLKFHPDSEFILSLIPWDNLIPPTWTLAILGKERDDVGNILRREVEKLMRLGADTCGMTYVCSSSNTSRPCTQPKNMCLSYTQNDSLMNLKRIHWMFHELTGSLHQDVLMHRMSHMDVVTRKVMWELNVMWGEKEWVRRPSNPIALRNCIVG
jgi:hypothetical protein